MTPRELLVTTPEKVIKLGEGWFNPLVGSCYCHVPELETQLQSWEVPKSDRIEFRLYKDFCFDHRRIWRLASVHFDGAPVMIIQNAGREGDDWISRFVLDGDAYAAMTAHMSSLFKPLIDNPSLTGMDEEVPKLANFYGHDLGDFFERSRY